MTRDEYIKAILRDVQLDKMTRKRLRADLEGDIDARLEAGESMEQLIADMGDPAEVAGSFAQSMQGTAVRKSPWRWLLLGLAVLLLLACGALVLFAAAVEHGMGALLAALAESSPARLFVDGKEASSIGIIGGADGPTAIFVTSYATPALPFLFVLAAGLALLGGFLLMQWKGTKKPVRFLVLGLAMLAAWLVLLLGGGGLGLIGWIWQSMAPVNDFWQVLLCRLLDPANIALLVVGILSLRRFWRARKQRQTD